jgi:hypothetical protein
LISFAVGSPTAFAVTAFAVTAFAVTAFVTTFTTAILISLAILQSLQMGFPFTQMRFHSKLIHSVYSYLLSVSCQFKRIKFFL